MVQATGMADNRSIVGDRIVGLDHSVDMYGSSSVCLTVHMNNDSSWLVR
jgi:hypothetical protein